MRRMLPLTLSLGAALGLVAAGGAYAAPGGGMGGPGGGMGMPMPSSPGGSRMAPMSSDSASSSGLREGMTVKDSAGVTVGKITKVGKSGGAPAALVEVGGKTVVVMGSTLSVSGDTATSNQTKDQIEALPEPKSS